MEIPDKAFDPARSLHYIGRLLRELDGDLRAFGPAYQAVEGLDVRSNLEQAAALLESTLAGLRREVVPYLQAQLDRLGIDESARGLRVQLGAGGRDAEGWVNLDVYPAQLALNARWGLPFADGSVRCIYASHVLEHFFFRFEALPLLKEMHRVLEPGGVVRLVVPDIGAFMQAWAQGDAAFFAAQDVVWPWARGCKTHLERFLEYAGANGYDLGFEGHKYGYDYPTLAQLLADAGFTAIERSQYMASRLPELALDALSPFASATTGEEHFSLFVEAARSALEGG